MDADVSTIPKFFWVSGPLSTTIIHCCQVGALVLGVCTAVGVVPVAFQARWMALVAGQIVPASNELSQLQHKHSSSPLAHMDLYSAHCNMNELSHLY